MSWLQDRTSTLHADYVKQ